QQTRLVQAGSGFLAQHSKELFFGLDGATNSVTAMIRWPSGLVQHLRDLPLNHRVWLEEGSAPSRIEPFRTPAAQAGPSAPAPADSAVEVEALPAVAETWLLEPVAAPDFSLPDLQGREQTLSSRRGSPVLLHFWSVESADSPEELANFDRLYAREKPAGLQLLMVNADQLAGADGGPELAPYRRLSLPILRASADAIAIYGILYRYIFDRHRDLTLPTSFLIDAAGAIVKIYQGRAPSERFGEDAARLPRTAAERVATALPFPGVSETFEFGRNNLSFGSIFFERGYMDQAEEFFRLALRDDPSSAEALYGLGSIYLRQQKNDAARQSFQRAVGLHASYPGTLPKAWNNLGILAARDGQTDEAIGDFERALQIDPANVIALENLGSAYRQEKRWAEARSALERALQLSPDDPAANYGLGMVFAQLDVTERAYQYLQKALAVHPDDPQVLNNLGVLFVRTHRLEEAEKNFQECIRVAPAFDQSYLNLARLYALQGDNRKARAVLLELLKQHPGHPQAEKELQQLSQ
ncbi:MAG: tetratricopeptide repeat protein, partial [Candidatus Acidiferrales bacterium]